MINIGKKCLAALLAASMVFGVTGCGRQKKAKKPYVQSTAEVKNGTAKAEGKGKQQSEVPLIIGCGRLDKNFNPFLAQAASDEQVMNLTQTKLFDTDRAGRLVEKGTGRHGILEIKTSEILRSIAREKWRDGVPDNYYVQLLHQLLATGWDFAVLHAQLKRVWDGEVKTTRQSYFIERAEVEGDLAYLLEQETKFWGYVQRDQMPPLILPYI